MVVIQPVTLLYFYNPHNMLNWLTVPFMTTLEMHLQYVTPALLWQGTVRLYTTIADVSYSVS